MAGVITTSIVVQFGSASDAENYVLSAEIDSRPNGRNKGITSFKPGDSPYILIYKSPELTLTFDVSTGSLSSRGSEQIQQVEYLMFANESSKELAKEPSGSVDLKYMAGKSGATRSGRTVKLPTPGVAVYKATYNATAYVYQLTGIPITLQGETSFPVVVMITGTSA